MTLNDISLNNKPATFTTARHIKVQPVEIALAECEILPLTICPTAPPGICKTVRPTSESA